MDLGRLEEDWQARVIDIIRRHAVVANQRIGADEQLTAVGRVGELLRIADHGSVEHNLAGGRRLRAKRVALEPSAIIKDERRLLALVGRNEALLADTAVHLTGSRERRESTTLALAAILETMQHWRGRHHMLA